MPDHAELERLVAQQRAQLDQLAYQKHILEQQVAQLQGNIDATYGSLQMLEHLMGTSPEEPNENREAIYTEDSDD